MESKAAAVLLPIFCFHPQYICSRSFSCHSKRILVSYNLSFETIISIIDDKRQQFIELSTFEFSNFVLQLSEILSRVSSKQRIKFKFGESKFFVCVATKNFFADQKRIVKIQFADCEICHLAKLCKIISLIAQKLLLRRFDNEKKNNVILMLEYNLISKRE